MPEKTLLERIDDGDPDSERCSRVNARDAVDSVVAHLGRLLIVRRGSDPDVERLLEGFAFLTGRIRQRLDDDLPEFTHGILSLIHPNFLQPVSATTIMEFTPLANVVTAPRRIEAGVEIDSAPVDSTACRFRTAAPVDVLPLRVANAETVRRGATTDVRVSFKLFDGANAGAQLAGALLIGTNLTGTVLDGADLASANLTNANLHGASLAGADLSGACLNAAVLVDANLGGAILADARAKSADFTAADLANAVLVDAGLDRARLVGAVLAGADLTGTRLTNTGFTMCFVPDLRLANASLTDVSFAENQPPHVDLATATCSGVALGGMDVRAGGRLAGDFGGQRFAGADLSGMDLTACGFAGGDLSGANPAGATAIAAAFSQSKLADADLTASDMRMAAFAGAHMARANLSRGRLDDAGLKGARCVGATFDHGSLVYARMARADLTTARFAGVNLHGADLHRITESGTDWRGADLTDAKRTDTVTARRTVAALGEAVIHADSVTSTVRRLKQVSERVEVTETRIIERAATVCRKATAFYRQDARRLRLTAEDGEKIRLG